MELVRSIERRLERLVEGVAGRIFRGALHPVELGARLVREADLALRRSPTGPVAPNVYVIRVDPGDPSQDSLPPGLGNELAAFVEATAAERGWRLEGPVRVHIELDRGQAPGTVTCTTEEASGPLTAWAYLLGSSDTLQIRRNRSLVGRGSSCDLVVNDPRVSRAHALVWREGGQIWVEDLDSANGTTVDGRSGTGPMPLSTGSVVSFGPAGFTFRLS